MTTAVDEQSSARRVLHSVLRGMVYALLLFILLGALLLIGNYVQVSRHQPVEHKILEPLLEELRENPGRDDLRDQVRALDLLARRAYFSSLTFSRAGAWLIIGAGLLLFICLQLMNLLRPPLPEVAGCAGMAESDMLAQPLTRWLIISFAGGVVLVALLFSYLGRNEYSITSLAVKQAEPPHSSLQGETSGALDSNSPESAELLPPSIAERESNWPEFRGPFGNGISPAADVPVNWNGESGEGIIWKVRVPRGGFSSPVVWEEKIFLTGGDKAAREIYCFDTESGELRWRYVVIGQAGKLPEVTDDTGFAASTAATDGRHVVAVFATGDVVCLDMNGNLIWQDNLGLPENPYGYASSLRLHEFILYVQFDNPPAPVLMAFDLRTGRMLFDIRRKVELSWATPLLLRNSQIILHAVPESIAYHPVNGKELWRTKTYTGELALSPAGDEKMIIIHDNDGELGGFDLSENKFRWHYGEEIPDVASPLLTDDLVILSTSYGPTVCLERESGKELWNVELPTGCYASPSCADGKIYLIDKQGITHIYRAARKMEKIGESPLGEAAVASPAFMDGRIYLRGYQYLYGIGN